MKKLVAALAAGIFIAGAATTTVSAEEHEVQKGESLWEIADKADELGLDASFWEKVANFFSELFKSIGDFLGGLFN